MERTSRGELVEDGGAWRSRLKVMGFRPVLPALILALGVAAVVDGRPVVRSAVVVIPLFLVALAWALWPLYGRNAGPARRAPGREDRHEDLPPSWDPAQIRQRLLDDPRLGATPDARRRFIHRWHMVSLALGALQACVLILAYLTRWSHPALLLPPGVPLLSLALELYLRVRFGAAFPSWTLSPACLFLILGTLGLGMVATVHNYQHFGPLIVPGLLFGAPLAGLCAWLDAPLVFAKSRSGGVALMLLICGFGLATLAEADRDLDASKPTSYVTTVQSQRISHGRRSVTYYLTLAPWGANPAPDEVSVGENLYDAAPVGSRICVRWRPGKLGAPWYDLDLC